MRNKRYKIQDTRCCRAFTLIEVVAALSILTLICSSVLLVIHRCLISAADSSQRMRAFEIAQENMEAILCKSSATETVDYGSSDKYPEIQWQSTVEAFDEPLYSQTWLQAVCSATYTDVNGQEQTVELTSWLTYLTPEQSRQITEEREKEKEWLAKAEQILDTAEEAAKYADVDVEIIQEWVKNGMRRTKDGKYIKLYLELYQGYDGVPPADARKQTDKDYSALIGAQAELDKPLPKEQKEKPEK